MLLSNRVAVLLAGAALSCASRSPQVSAPTESAPEQVETADAPAEVPTQEAPVEEEANIPVSEDKSFQASVYVASGMPELSEQWNAAELVAAGKALASLGNKNRLFLPREGSPQSGEVFAKLISPENFNSLDAEDPKLATAAALELTQVIPQFLALYAKRQGDDVSFPREQVRWIEALLVLYPKVLVTLRAGASAEVISADQLEQQKRVATAIFQGATGMLEEKDTYRESDLQILRDALAKNEEDLEAALNSPEPSPAPQ